MTRAQLGWRRGILFGAFGVSATVSGCGLFGRPNSAGMRTAPGCPPYEAVEAVSAKARFAFARYDQRADRVTGLNADHVERMNRRAMHCNLLRANAISADRFSQLEQGIARADYLAALITGDSLLIRAFAAALLAAGGTPTELRQFADATRTGNAIDQYEKADSVAAVHSDRTVDSVGGGSIGQAVVTAATGEQADAATADGPVITQPTDAGAGQSGSLGRPDSLPSGTRRSINPDSSGPDEGRPSGTGSGRSLSPRPAVSMEAQVAEIRSDLALLRTAVAPLHELAERLGPSFASTVTAAASFRAGLVIDSAVVNFGHNVDSLPAGDAQALVASLRSRGFTDPGYIFSVVGYASAEGSAAYNLSLSDRRAAFTERLLARAGVPPARVSRVGAGATPEFGPAGRRVVVYVLVASPVRAVETPADSTP